MTKTVREFDPFTGEWSTVRWGELGIDPGERAGLVTGDLHIDLQERMLDAFKAVSAEAVIDLASREQWERLPDVVYSLRGMLDGAGSMKRADIAVLSDAFGILRELLLRRPAEFGGPRECR